MEQTRTYWVTCVTQQAYFTWSEQSMSTVLLYKVWCLFVMHHDSAQNFIQAKKNAGRDIKVSFKKVSLRTLLCIYENHSFNFLLL